MEPALGATNTKKLNTKVGEGRLWLDPALGGVLLSFSHLERGGLYWDGPCLWPLEVHESHALKGSPPRPYPWATLAPEPSPNLALATLTIIVPTHCSEGLHRTWPKPSEALPALQLRFHPCDMRGVGWIV